jgi:decaprenylphospho-beta-D-ribofuranose 2-oxidase
MPDRAESHLLTGWGRTAPTRAAVVTADQQEVVGVVGSATGRGVLARGLGRSYGDAAQNAGGTVVRLTSTELAVDAEECTATVSGGVSLDRLIAELLPRELFPMVTPGTRQATVGGAIACDVHGKNHHLEGSFGDHVLGFELVTGDGTVRWVDPKTDPDLFWATVGGMGLTGIITRATIRLRRVPSAYMSVVTERLDDLEGLMSRMSATDGGSTYTVAWVDTVARGRRLGRSVLTRGEHAPTDQLSARQAADPFRPGVPAPRVAVPRVAPGALLSRPAVRSFNELWFRRAPRNAVSTEHFTSFFHPLDAVRDWNRLYGRRGFLQYQFVVPDSAAALVPEVIHAISTRGMASFLTVLKRLGPQNAGVLSFPLAGWTLALDLPLNAEVRQLLTRLDERVADSGGRVYLAKDARLSPACLRKMYPRTDALAECRRRSGAVGVFTSDLARRLELDRDAG